MQTVCSHMYSCSVHKVTKGDGVYSGAIKLALFPGYTLQRGGGGGTWYDDFVTFYSILWHSHLKATRHQGERDVAFPYSNKITWPVECHIVLPITLHVPTRWPLACGCTVCMASISPIGHFLLTRTIISWLQLDSTFYWYCTSGKLCITYSPGTGSTSPGANTATQADSWVSQEGWESVAEDNSLHRALLQIFWKSRPAMKIVMSDRSLRYVTTPFFHDVHHC